MKLHFTVLVVLLFFFFNQANAQFGIQLNTPASFEKYLLFRYQDDYYLVDNCGNKVHQWDDQPIALHHAKLARNGDLLLIDSDNIYRVDWEGNANIIYTNTDDNFFFNYEVIEMNNGNFLCLGRRYMSDEIRQQLAWNSPSEVYDVVVEVDGGANAIVWEWRSIDHTIQDRVASASNFGMISEHPELMSFDRLSAYDWESEGFMINGMDYNENLDQIVLSLRRLSEIAIIDHSTTTQEAAGHSGGTYGRGGDLLYRWGNPQNYDHGTEEDRMLYFQHNPNWIQHGEHAGKIILFNNGLTRYTAGVPNEYSSVDIIQTPIDSSNNYYQDSLGIFGPLSTSWSYDEMDAIPPMFSGYTSGAKVLSNGNILITIGAPFEVLEVTPDKEPSWNYFILPSGFLFRTEAYAPDFSGFIDHELTPNGPLENPPSNYDCEYYSSTNRVNTRDDIIHITPVSDRTLIYNQQHQHYAYSIVSAHGIILASGTTDVEILELSYNQLPSGMYIVVVEIEENIITKKIFIP